MASVTYSVYGSSSGGAPATRATAPARATQQSQADLDDQREAVQEESIPPFEADFVASTIFQEATVIARLRSPVTLDAHYFGVEDNDVGTIGLSWNVSWHGLIVAPGFAWSFGRDNRPAPVLTARWSYQQLRWLTEGLWVQSLKAYVPGRSGEGGGEATEGAAEEQVRHASVLDAIHVCARLGRAELGPLLEHIQYREEREWKGGVRAAWIVARGVRLVAQVLGPGTEVRGGFAWER